MIKLFPAWITRKYPWTMSKLVSFYVVGTFHASWKKKKGELVIQVQFLCNLFFCCRNVNEIVKKPKNRQREKSKSSHEEGEPAALIFRVPRTPAFKRISNNTRISVTFYQTWSKACSYPAYKSPDFKSYPI